MIRLGSDDRACSALTLLSVMLSMTAFLVPSSYAFLPNVFQSSLPGKADLIDIANRQEEISLNINFRIGSGPPNDGVVGDRSGSDSSRTAVLGGSQLAVSNFKIKLHPETIQQLQQHQHHQQLHVKLPGADGGHKKISTGHRALEVLQDGQFVNMMGTQYVHAEQSCWELCWVKDRPAGTLICGFHVPDEYSRNDAKIPKGNLYVSFVVWTEQGLKEGQAEKDRVEAQIEALKKDRQEHMSKFDTTNNPIMKALHLRNAFAVIEKQGEVPHRKLENIPSKGDDLVRLQNNLLLNPTGHVFTMETNHFGQHQHMLMGYANVRIDNDDNGITTKAAAVNAMRRKKNKNRLMP